MLRDGVIGDASAVEKDRRNRGQNFGVRINESATEHVVVVIDAGSKGVGHTIPLKKQSESMYGEAVGLGKAGNSSSIRKGTRTLVLGYKSERGHGDT